MTIYKISGKERRSLKKKLSLEKMFARNFWRFHMMEKDMKKIFGGNVLEQKEAQVMYDKKLLEIKEMESKLNTEL